MCDLGAGLGIVSGGLKAVGANQTASANAEISRQQQLANLAVSQREFILENQAANKQGFQAQLAADRAESTIIAQGESAGGLSIGQRSAEQKRQGALNIFNTQDRSEQAGFNFENQVTINAQETENQIAINTPQAGTSFLNTITSGVSGYGRFG